MILTIDANSRILFANPAVEKVFGYTAAELAGESLTILMPERMRAGHHAGFLRYLQTGERRLTWSSVQVPGLRRDGQEIQLEISFGESDEHAQQRRFTAVMRDCTERKRIEAALRQSEERYRFLAETVPQQVWTARPDGRMVYGNRRAIEYFGENAEAELLGMQWLGIIHPDDRAQCAERWRRALETGERYESEFRLRRRADGEYRWHLSQAVPMTDATGKIIKWLGTNTDVHDRRVAADALRKSEEYRNLFRHASDAILIFEPENETILDVNDKACETYGIEREQFIGRSLRDLSENRERGDEHLRGLLADGKPQEFETVQFRPDQTLVHFLVSASLIEFNGKPAVLSVNRDITARKRIEFERLQSEARLRESEQLFRSFMNNNPAVAFMKDDAGRYVYVNQTMERLFELKENPILGKTDREWMPQDAARQVGENDCKVLTTNETVETEEIVPTPDGVRRHWMVYKFPFTGASGGRYIGGVAMDITMRKLAEERLQYDAFHDALTGLPNRALFIKFLRRAIERKRREQNNLFAVLFLDFDRFKVINDSLGHTEGDKLLVMLARRIEAVLRPGDSVARFGGDEFTVLLEDLSEPAAAAIIAERLQQHLQAPFDLNGRVVSMTASIGIALGSGEARTAEEMLRDADIAMYRAKAAGKARHEMFDPTMYRQAMTKLETEIELRRALECGEFRLHYQPIIELATDRLVGFESLIRWQHPLRGTVSPAEFIPAAEENNLIVGIGEFTLRESCRQLREWQLQNRCAADLTISVNLSCRQFLQPDLLDQIRRTLIETRLDARCLKLEITESHVMENSRAAVETMNQLRALGVEFSLDDFGTGYSSLSYLHRLPASFLKVDRSFVSRMGEADENYQIVRTIINLAQNLKKKVVAEGIETIEQLDLLKRLGCDYGQGYLLAKPLAAPLARELIVKSEQRDQKPALDRTVSFGLVG